MHAPLIFSNSLCIFSYFGDDVKRYLSYVELTMLKNEFIPLFLGIAYLCMLQRVLKTTLEKNRESFFQGVISYSIRNTFSFTVVENRLSLVQYDH